MENRRFSSENSSSLSSNIHLASSGEMNILMSNSRDLSLRKAKSDDAIKAFKQLLKWCKDNNLNDSNTIFIHNGVSSGGLLKGLSEIFANDISGYVTEENHDVKSALADIQVLLKDYECFGFGDVQYIEPNIRSDDELKKVKGYAFVNRVEGESIATMGSFLVNSDISAEEKAISARNNFDVFLNLEAAKRFFKTLESNDDFLANPKDYKFFIGDNSIKAPSTKNSRFFNEHSESGATHYTPMDSVLTSGQDTVYFGDRRINKTTWYQPRGVGNDKEVVEFDALSAYLKIVVSLGADKSVPIFKELQKHPSLLKVLEEERLFINSLREDMSKQKNTIYEKDASGESLFSIVGDIGIEDPLSLITSLRDKFINKYTTNNLLKTINGENLKDAVVLMQDFVKDKTAFNRLRAAVIENTDAEQLKALGMFVFADKEGAIDNIWLPLLKKEGFSLTASDNAMIEAVNEMVDVFLYTDASKREMLALLSENNYTIGERSSFLDIDTKNGDVETYRPLAEGELNNVKDSLIKNKANRDVEDRFKASLEKQYAYIAVYLSDKLKNASTDKDKEEAFNRLAYYVDNLKGFKRYLVNQFVTQDDNSINYSSKLSPKDVFGLFGVFSLKNFKEDRTHVHFNGDDFINIWKAIDISNKKEFEKIKHDGFIDLHMSKFTKEFERNVGFMYKEYKTERFDYDASLSYKENIEKLISGKSIEEVSDILANLGKSDRYQYSDTQYINYTNAGKSKNTILFEKTNDNMLDKVVGTETANNTDFAHLVTPFGGLDPQRSVASQVSNEMISVACIEFHSDIQSGKQPSIIIEPEKFNTIREGEAVTKELEKMQKEGANISFDYSTPSYIKSREFFVSKDGEVKSGVPTSTGFDCIITQPKFARVFVQKGFIDNYATILDRYFSQDVYVPESRKNFTHMIHYTNLNELTSNVISEYFLGKNIVGKNGENIFTASSKFAMNAFSILSDFPGQVKDKMTNKLKESLNTLRTSLSDVSANDLVTSDGKGVLVNFISSVEKDLVNASERGVIGARNKNGEVTYMPFGKQHSPSSIEATNKSMVLTQRGTEVALQTALTTFVPKDFYEKEGNVQALIQGKDENGNNLLHLLFKHPLLFSSHMEANSFFEENGHMQFKNVLNLQAFLLNKSRLQEDYETPICDLLKRIPADEFEKMANEKNAKGRTPLEEFAYNAVAIRASTLLPIAKMPSVATAIEKLIIASDNVNENTKFTVLNLTQENLSKPKSASSVIADETEINMKRLMQYLSSPKEVVKFNDINVEVSNDVELSSGIQNALRAKDNRIQSAITKLPI